MSEPAPTLLTKREAIFAPKRVDDLVHSMHKWIGRRVTVQFANYVDDGPYEGQEMWITFPMRHEVPLSDIAAWIPACDLEFI